MLEVDRLRASGVEVDISAVSAGQVAGDRAQLPRAIHNLADNAVRHASHTVTFTLHEEVATVVLVVSDDGPGVPPAERERIFERFARADEGRSRDHGGSGLGLAIVRDVVEWHGGTIVIDGTYAAGARFVVRLPVAVG
jgi:signal transduction histidine kinase